MVFVKGKLKAFMTRAKNRAMAAGFAAAVAAAFFSCDMGLNSDSFQNKVQSYFLEMTSTAAVGDYIISPGDILTDNNGATCVPSSNDHTVTFFLRNPQKYSFALHDNMELQLGGLAEFSSSDVSVAQDANDKSKIVITYSASFLRRFGEGTDISPKVTLLHPVSRANFGVYDKLNLSSNSPPPVPSGAVAMQTSETPSKWVVCFDLPVAGSMKDIHKDLKTVTINGQAFDISVNSSGAISYDSSAQTVLTTSAPGGLVANQNTGMSFASSGQASYFATGQNADENEKIFNITLTDTAGLSSSLSVSARGFKLSNPAAFEVDDTAYEHPFTLASAAGDHKNNVSQEDDGSARVRIHADALTASVTYDKIDPDTGTTIGSETINPQAYDSSNAYIVYEVYQEEACATLLASGRINGLNGIVTMPDTNCWIKAFVRKPLYADSDAIIWQCHAVCKSYYVSSSGLASNPGSKAAPLDSIQNAIDKFNANISDYNQNDIVTVYVMSDLIDSAPASWSQSGDTMPTLRIAGYGGTRTIDAHANYGSSTTVLNVLDGKVIADKLRFNRFEDYPAIKFTAYSDSSLECNSCVFEGLNADVSGCAIYLSGYGRLVANSCVFENCKSDISPGIGVIYVDVGTSATLKSCSIKKCHAHKGGAIYNKGSLSLENCTITQNEVDVDSGAVHHEGTYFEVSGTNYILGNTRGSSSRDVFLPEGTAYYIRVAGPITGSRIGVYRDITSDAYKPTAGNPKAFTSGFGTSTTGQPAGEVFVSNMLFGIDLDRYGEAAFAVSGGAMYNAFDYTINFSAADSSVTGMYPGQAITYSIEPYIYRDDGGGNSTSLHINPVDYKLYANNAGGTYSGLACDDAVTLKAQLWAGARLAKDNLAVSYDSSETIKVAVPAQALEDSYSVKIIATFLGRQHSASFGLACQKNLANAPAYIMSLTQPTTVVLEGIHDYTESDTDYRDALEEARSALATAPVLVGIDISSCTGLTKLDSRFLAAKTVQGVYGSKLKSLALPATIKELNTGALNGCSNLESITFEGTKEQWGLISRAATWYTSLNTTQVHCLGDDSWVELDWRPSLSGAYTVLPAETTGTVSGATYVTFGLWPQTKKASGVSIYTNRTKVVGSYPYYLGSDYEWYAEKSGDYYKVEPIKWRVVTDNYSGKKLLLAEKALFYMRWDSYSKNYKNSDVRAWLNGDFINAAFTNEEQSMIPATDVDNSADSTTDVGGNIARATSAACDNTNDQIFLLSVYEATITAYGFAAYDYNDNARKRAPTDFTLASGAESIKWHNPIGWWLRSPSNTSGNWIFHISNQGKPSDNSNATSPNDGDWTTGGIVPALCVNP